MSSCFFSSREKMRIWPISVVRKCLRTVLPNEPVPPVIIRVALVNADIKIPPTAKGQTMYSPLCYLVKVKCLEEHIRFLIAVNITCFKFGNKKQPGCNFY